MPSPTSNSFLLQFVAAAARAAITGAVPTFLCGLAIGLERYRRQTTTKAEVIAQTAIVLAVLVLYAAWCQWGRRRIPLWRITLECVAIGYAGGLAANLYFVFRSPLWSEAVAGMVHHARLLVGLFLLPLVQATWLIGALFAWFSWIGFQEAPWRLKLLVLSALLMALAGATNSAWL